MRVYGRLLSILGCLGLLISMAHAAVGGQDPVADVIRERVEQLRSAGGLQIEGVWLAATNVIPQLYERRAYQPIWTQPGRIDELLGAISAAEEDGLNPQDYSEPILERLRTRVLSGEKVELPVTADLDLLYTDSLIRLAYHLHFGKVDPERVSSDWNFVEEIDAEEPVIAVEGIIGAESLAVALDALVPKDAFYDRLKHALAQHRKILARGGWPQTPDGPVLKPGMVDARVAALRIRLAASGDLPELGGGQPELFDETLQAAVERFQERHSLDVDGVVGGGGTIAALNTPVEARIDQIRANLERARWVLRQLAGAFVLVDIAGFEVIYYRPNREIAWRARAQVGRPYRKTPVFRDQISYLEFNPTWTIPRGILSRDVLPAVKRDPNYLSQRNIRVIDGSGKTVDAASLDWSKYTGENFPYQLRQDPGAENALGRVKFMFPNEYAVYLHDTPSKSLFERHDRAFSSGCIRVDRPFELAQILLNDSAQWNRDNIQRLIESGRTQRVTLAEKVPVLLLYWTVEVDEDADEARFKRDIYERDPPIVRALEGEFQFRERDRPLLEQRARAEAPAPVS